MSRRGQIIFFVPAVALFAIFVLAPSAQCLVDSFWPPANRHFVGIQLYQFALRDAPFHQALRNNLIYLLWTLLTEVGAGLVLAVGLERAGRMNQLLRLAFFSPAVLSMVVIGLVFGFLFKDGIGIWPGMLNERHALITISLISGWAAAGFFMVIFLAGLAAIPEELLEAARLDGATAWQVFWQVKLPMLRDVGIVALLICFTGAFKAFDLFWVMLPNQDHTAILSTLLVKEFFKFDHPGYGSTLAVLLTSMVFATVVVLGLARRWWQPPES